MIVINCKHAKVNHGPSALLTSDQHHRHQVDRDAVVGFVIQPFEVDFLLVVINTGYQPGPVHVDPDLEKEANGNRGD